MQINVRFVPRHPGVFICDEMVVVDARDKRVKVSGPLTPHLGAVIAALKQAMGPSALEG